MTTTEENSGPLHSASTSSPAAPSISSEIREAKYAAVESNDEEPPPSNDDNIVASRDELSPNSSPPLSPDPPENFEDELPLEITESVRTPNADEIFQQGNNNNNNENEDDDSSSSNQRISWMDACMHLMKGNLGPGCLNIPHAFVLSGWLLGSALFMVVAVQGIYSMYILSYCKDLLVHQHHQAAQQASRQQQPPIATPTFTFMTVAQHTLGSKIHVQVFLFALQVGVCCVFLSLLSTNLKAQLNFLSSAASVFIVTIALLGVVLQRFLKGLRWLSTIANVFMVTAIVTACVFGIAEFRQNKANEDAPRAKLATNDWGDIATFVSAMFFSFEGIGLVLPVENSFTAGYATLQEESKANQRYRQRVLPGAMSMVGILFIAIGISASLGYPDIENGSITAYLKEKYPNNLWLDIVNVLVMLAVFLTFPLQLTPAMEVLEEWLYGSQEDDASSCCLTRIIPGGHYHFQIDQEAGPERIERVDSNDAHRADALLESADTEEPAASPPPRRYFCCSSLLQYANFCCLPRWVIQRYMVVFGCALVVLVVDDLGLLMSLFGAVGQTGLALMPCVIHWSLQRQGVAPKNRLLQMLDLFTISFSTLVMITGVGYSIQKLLQKGAAPS